MAENFELLVTSKDQVVGPDGQAVDPAASGLVDAFGHPIPRTVSPTTRRSPDEMEAEAARQRNESMYAILIASKLVDRSCHHCYGRGFRGWREHVVGKSKDGRDVVVRDPDVCGCIKKRLKKVSKKLELKQTLTAKEYCENEFFWDQ